MKNHVHPVVVHPHVVTISAIAFTLLCGCAAHKPPGNGVAQRSPLPVEGFRLDLATIAVTPVAKPALVRFDHAQGQVDSVAARARDAASRTLNPPELADPVLTAAVSPLMLALVPFSAAHAAMKGVSGVRVSP